MPLLPDNTIIVSHMSNREFLETYAQAGRIGLSGGIAPFDKAIRRAQRHLNDEHKWGLWTHAFIFQGRRHDGHHWVIESNLSIAHKHIRLGVQENRITNFFNHTSYPFLAVLDFGLSEEQTQRLLGEALELVASRACYSLHELFGTAVALRFPALRNRENLLARKQSFYCCAFVHHIFKKIGIDLAPGISSKLTTPEDISLTTTPHATYLLQRDIVRSHIDRVRIRARRRLKARIRSLKRD